MEQWLEGLSCTAVTWVQFPNLGSPVGLAFYCFLVITPQVFIQDLQFSSPYRSQCSKFQLDLETVDKKSHLAFSQKYRSSL